MRTLILLLLAGCAACSTGASTGAGTGAQAASSASAPAAKQGAAAPADTLARIRALAGNAACSEDAQCHTLALGSRACGGPESYLAWSSAGTRQAEIEALGERYKEERRAADKAAGMMSTCQFISDPGAVCRAGTCQLGQGNPAAR